MINIDQLLEDAPLYALGFLEGEDKAAFEKGLQESSQLQNVVKDFSNISGLLPSAIPILRPPIQLKERILSQVSSFGSGFVDCFEKSVDAAIVIAGKDERIIWANEAFTRMCGYTLAELKGRKPGVLLQGPETDPADIAYMREAVKSRKACSRTILNHHKDGSVYRVNIQITPLWDANQEFQGFVAFEELVGTQAA